MGQYWNHLGLVDLALLFLGDSLESLCCKTRRFRWASCNYFLPRSSCIFCSRPWPWGSRRGRTNRPRRIFPRSSHLVECYWTNYKCRGSANQWCSSFAFPPSQPYPIQTNSRAASTTFFYRASHLEFSASPPKFAAEGKFPIPRLDLHPSGWFLTFRHPKFPQPIFAQLT